MAELGEITQYISSDVIDLSLHLQQEARAFLLVIMQNPTDGVSKCIFADWLDEHDQPTELSFCYRWMGKRCLHPHKREKYPDSFRYDGTIRRKGSKVPDIYAWAWYNAHVVERTKKYNVPKYSCLRRNVINAKCSREHAYFPSYAAAINELAGWLKQIQTDLEV